MKSTSLVVTRGPQSRGISASLRRLAVRRAVGTLAAGLALGAGLLPAASAATFNYTGGGTGSAAAPVSGVFSTGFDNPVSGSTAADTLSFQGSTDYTATDDLTTQILANMLNFTNTAGTVTLARGSGANNSISLGGTAPSVVTSAGAVLNGLDLTLAANTTFNIGAGGMTASGIVSGAGTVTKTGAGALTFSGANTYTGTTTISSGTLVSASATGLGTTTNGVSFTGTTGVLDLRTDGTGDNAYNITIGSGAAGTIASDVLTGNVGINHTLGALKLSTVTLNIIKGSNVTSGTPTITFGSLNLGAGASGGVSVVNPTSANLSLGTINIGQNAVPKSVQLDGTSTGNTVTGIISNGLNTVSVTKANTSTWTLSGANTYTGSTTVSNGTLTLSGNRTAAAGGFTVGNQTGSTATLNVSNGSFTTGAFVLGSGVASAVGIVNQTGGTLTLSGNQLLVGNAGTGTTAGSNTFGTYNLSGGRLNTLAGTLGVVLGTNTGTTGTFNLSGTGTLAMPATSTLQIGRSDTALAINTTGVFSQTGGTATVGILQMGGSSAGSANGAGANATLNLTGGTFSAVTFNQLSGGDGSTSQITIGGTAQATLPAFPTGRGSGATVTLTFDGGTLSPAAASSSYISGLTSAVINSGGANFNVATGNDITIPQALSASATSTGGGLTKLGAGGLTLSGTNTYTGVTTITAGTLTAAQDGALGSGNVTCRQQRRPDTDGRHHERLYWRPGQPDPVRHQQCQPVCQPQLHRHRHYRQFVL